MAQIPVPNFGQSVAQPAQAASPQSLDTTSGTMQALNVAEGAYNQHVQQQDAAKGALAVATTQNAMYDAHDEVTHGLQDGSIKPEDAQEELKQRLAAIHDVNSQGLKDHQAAMLQQTMATTGGALSRQLGDSVFKYNQSETAATIDATGAQLQRDAIRRGPAAAADTYDAIVDMTGPSAGFTPAQIQSKKQAFRENTTAGYYQDKGAALHAADDLTGVTDTLHEVMGPAGDAMSPQQRAQVTNHLVGLQNNILAKQARDANDEERKRVARENAAADAYNANLKVVMDGSYLSPDAIADLTAKTAGTTLEKSTTALLSSQAQVAGFASKSADQRAAILEHYRSEGANPAVGTSPDSQKSITLLQKIDSKANELAKDDPWKAAQTYGVIINAPVMDASNAENVLPLLDMRMQQIGKVEAWVGRKVSPLQPHEAEQLGESLKALPPGQAASVLSNIGQMIGDSQRIAAVSKQLGDTNGTMGLAMAYAGDRSNDGKLTGEYIIRGETALKNKTSLVDTTAQSGWKATIYDKVNGAFSSQEAENKAMEAAYKIAAGNGGDVDAAIKMATGGIIMHGLGKIPLPINMDESTFDKRLAAITPALLTPQAPDGNVYVGGAQVPLPKFVASLPDATLVHAGQGMYAVKAGASFVTNAAGQRIVLRISQ